MSNAPKKRFFHVLSLVGCVLGVLCSVTGWMILSTPTQHRTGPGVALALGAGGLWISFAGWLVYSRAVERQIPTRFSRTLIWIGMTASALGALAFVVF